MGYKTNKKRLENTRNYRKTRKGVITNIYNKQKERSKLKGLTVEYSLKEFQEWCFNSFVFEKLFVIWEEKGHLNGWKPSIDRINPLKGYSFDNIQVLTYDANREKGDKEKIILWGKKIKQYSLDGQHIATYPSLKVASEVTGINKNNISAAAHKHRNQAGGYYWMYVEEGKWRRNIYENPELLEK